MSEWDDFVEERELLLTPKPDQIAIDLANELVRLMELLAIHGSTGIDGDPARRSHQILQLTERIRGAA